MGSFLVGVVGAAFTGDLTPSALRVSSPHTWQWIVGMTVLVASVSFLDDRRGVAVWFRLSVHIIAASGVVLGGGLALSTVAIPLVGAVELGWFAPLVAILFLVWMADLFNFMDGMDGFAGLALCRRLRKSEALVRGGAVGDQAKLLSSGTPISGGLEWTALHDRSTEDAASVKCIVEFS